MVVKRSSFEHLAGDDRPFDPAHLLGTAEVLVLWGANHYADRLPPSPTWLVWDKRAGITTDSFSDAELAWVSPPKSGGSVRLVRHFWSGMIRESERGERRTHPTQKPVVVQSWIVERYTEAGDLVADYYAGSGATVLACERLGRRCHAAEIEPRYAAAVLERWHQETGGRPELSAAIGGGA
jgi:hypothetical protein